MSCPLKRGRCKKPKEEINKEEVAEDLCFECKDGGRLLICEYKDCLKAFHPRCVGKDDTILDSDERWTCNWHSCSTCPKSSKFHCFCCTYSVCKSCIQNALFVCVRRNKGFCTCCLKIARYAEEKRDVDSDGGKKVDFNNRDTYEFLFKDYWDFIKEKEGLVLDDLHTADALLKKGESYRDGSDSDQDFDADMDYTMESEQYSLTGGLKQQDILSPKIYRRTVKSKKREFIGWGSRPLVEFLASIGKDTSKPLSQYEVRAIIITYVQENKLTHPDKKKKIQCDAKLFSVFGRKSINRNKMNDLLEPHFADNEDSEEDDLIYNSEDKEIETTKTSKRQKMSSSSFKKEGIVHPRSCFASITARNLKLVYLRRSLVEDFLKNPEIYDRVIGSFVRIKSDPNDYLQRNAYQLVQVIGTKKAFGTGNTSEEITVQVSHMHKNIPVRMLSDDDFLEEEVEDLKKRVNDGVLKKITVVELDVKAKNLHENLTNHWIDRELVLLENRINQANEKGWRRELGEYLERRQLLKTPSERLRLLQEVPEIIAEEIEPEVASQDLHEGQKIQKDDSLRPTRDLSLNDLLDNATLSSYQVEKTYPPGPGDALSENVGPGDMPNLFDVEVKGVSVDGEVADKIVEGIGDVTNVNGSSEVIINFVDRDVKRVLVGNVAEKIVEGPGDVINVDAVSEVLPILFDVDVKGVLLDGKGADIMVEGSGEAAVRISRQDDEHLDSKESPCAADKHEGDDLGIVKKRVYGLPVIDLDLENDILEIDDDNPESEIWYYMDPMGNTQGPFPMSKLKQWSESNWFNPDFMVWKAGQTEKEAILLTDTLSRMF